MKPSINRLARLRTIRWKLDHFETTGVHGKGIKQGDRRSKMPLEQGFMPINKAAHKGIDFCFNSLYPQTRQALPSQQELHRCFTTFGICRLASVAPQGGAFSPVGKRNLQKPAQDKARAKPNNLRYAAQARVEPQRNVQTQGKRSFQ